MTFCLGIKVREGLVGIADTRITAGNECITAKKVFVNQRKSHSMFIMTSGLRSLRDKAITYFHEVIEEKDEKFQKLYEAVNEFGEQVRRVSREDRKYLEAGGLDFNLRALVGGQLEDDDEHKLYLLYPEGNWVEVGQASPYYIIGTSGYGKPLLDRVLTYETPMKEAVKMGFLAFDATRTSSNDVEYPLDFVIYTKDSFDILEARRTREDLREVSKRWFEIIRDAVGNVPSHWVEEITRPSVDDGSTCI